MMTRQQYIEYLISTPINYTCSKSADSYLIIGESVQDKRYSTKIEMVKRQ